MKAVWRHSHEIFDRELVAVLGEVRDFSDILLRIISLPINGTHARWLQKRGYTTSLLGSPKRGGGK